MLTLYDVRLLRIGRHFRLPLGSKLVVGRNEVENLRLEDLFKSSKSQARCVTLLLPEDFKGPAALIIGDGAPDAIGTVGGMLLRYGKQTSGEKREVRAFSGEEETRVEVSFALDDAALDSLRIPDSHVAGSYRPPHRRTMREAREKQRA